MQTCCGKLIDLNDLRVFAYVASLESFSLAADALQMHKSSVSRSIARLETMLDTPLLQRTTRKVLLTRRGIALREQCEEILSLVDKTLSCAGDVDAEFTGALQRVLSPQACVDSAPALVRGRTGG